MFKLNLVRYIYIYLGMFYLAQLNFMFAPSRDTNMFEQFANDKDHIKTQFGVKNRRIFGAL